LAAALHAVGRNADAAAIEHEACEWIEHVAPEHVPALFRESFVHATQ